MEDIHQYNFTVKSNIHDYEVKFIDNVKNTLLIELKEGDFIIIDKKIKELYSKWFDEILNKFNFTSLNTSEELKSYQKIEPIINSLIESGFRKNHRLIAIGG